MDATIVNQGSFFEWLKGHSYAIFLAVIIIVGDWAVIEFRMNQFEKDLKGLELKVEENRLEIEQIQIDRAKDMAEIKTLLIGISKNVDALMEQQRQRDKDIQEFYEKYGGVLNRNGN